jgi:signal peptidase I
MSSKATWKTVSEKLLWIVKYGCTFYVVQKYGIEASMCVGPSMEPTLNAKGDIVVLEHISTRWGTLKPGDVVVAKSPSSPHSYICKRVKVVVSNFYVQLSFVGFDICIYREINLLVLVSGNIDNEHQNTYLEVTSGYKVTTSTTLQTRENMDQYQKHLL